MLRGEVGHVLRGEVGHVLMGRGWPCVEGERMVMC